jgi:hypothetical protein
MAFLDGGLSLKPETLEYLRKKGRLPPQDESPPAELIDAFKQKPPAGMDDAAYQQAADHDKADLGKRQSSDSLNFATALITNTPQYQPKENHESAASAVLKRRQLHEQGQAGEKDLRKFLLTEWYKAKAEGREFNHKAALKVYEQGEQDRRDATKHKNDIELQDRRDAAALKRTQEMSQRPSGQPAYQVVVGPDGEFFGVNRRDPSQPAVPVTKPGSAPQPLTKQRKPIPEGAKKDLGETREIRDALVSLSSRFKDQYAGGGLLGGAATSAYQAMGSSASPQAQEDAAFWADYSRFIDIAERHAKFGASLTANEKQSWEQAKNLNPRADPRLVRKKFKEMIDIVNRRLSGHADALRVEDYDPAAIDALTRGSSDAKPAADAALSPKDQEAKAWAEANPGDPRATAIMERLKGR